MPRAGARSKSRTTFRKFWWGGGGGCGGERGSSFMESYVFDQLVLFRADICSVNLDLRFQ